MCSRVSLFTASGRENARETVERWTPAAFATTSILRSAIFFSSVLVVICLPNRAHRIFELGQCWQPPESIFQCLRDTPDERIIERVTVHVDHGGLGCPVQRRERGRTVRVDGGESRPARRRVAAVP